MNLYPIVLTLFTMALLWFVSKYWDFALVAAIKAFAPDLYISVRRKRLAELTALLAFASGAEHDELSFEHQELSTELDRLERKK